DGCELGIRCGVPINPIEVARVLGSAGQRAVISGSHVASAWCGRARGHAPAILIVPHARRAAAHVLRAWPDLTPVPSLKTRARADCYRFVRGKHCLIELRQ